MSYNETGSQLPHHDVGNMFLQIFLIIELIVGLPGILVALWIFCLRMKKWKSHEIFLFNLVLADFLLLMSVPFRLDTHSRNDNWRFGSTWCRINLYMLAVNRSASIAFMTVVAAHRYFKVLRPHHPISRLTRTQAVVLTGLAWTVAVAFRIPLLTVDLLQKSGNISLCRSFHSYEVIPAPILGYYVSYTAEFFLPWFFLIFSSVSISCHLRRRRLDRQARVQRAIRALIVISTVFTLCFMPSVVTGLAAWYIKNAYPEDFSMYNLWTHLFMISISFTYLNSALDPLIYFYSSSTYRDTLKNSFVKRRRIRAAGKS
ncbi:hydroxycarboxylic acid receptor 2 [Menidia menidia]